MGLISFIKEQREKKNAKRDIEAQGCYICGSRYWDDTYRVAVCLDCKIAWCWPHAKPVKGPTLFTCCPKCGKPGSRRLISKY